MNLTRINTQVVAPEERFDLFYESIARRVMPMTPRWASCARDFQARMLAAHYGSRGAMLVEAPAHFVRRGRAEIRTGDPEMVHLGCILGGSRWLLNASGEYRLRRGRIFMTCSDRPFALDARRGRYTGVTLAVPRAELKGLDLNLLCDPRAFDELATGEILRQILKRAADALETDAAHEIPFLCSAAFGALKLGLNHGRCCATAEAQPKVTSELVRMEIARNYGDADLTAERTACQLGVSVRALQRALAREELSFRGMLRDQRMRAAYEALATTSEPIDRIANACGYGELSSFYRAFKQKFERTPNELRSETFLLKRFEPPGSTVSSVG